MRRVLLLVCLAAAGCGMALPDKAAQPSCSSNAECTTAGEVCYADGCGSAVDFAVRVTPNSANYVVQDFNPVSVAMSRMDLMLQQAGVVEGHVQLLSQGQTSDYTDGFTVDGLGVSTVIPGLAFPQPLSQTVDSGSSFFSLLVPPGSWSLTATPSAPSPLPSRESPPTPVIPPVFAQRSVDAATTLDPDFVFPGDSLNELQGNLMIAAGQPWPQDAQHRWFMRYQALDAVSQAPLSQPAVFLTTSTFHVFTAVHGTAMILRVSPDPKLSPEAVGPTKDFLSDDQGVFGPFEMGDFGAPVIVSGSVQDPSGMPVGNASVSAQGVVAGGGSFSATGSTDASGAFSLYLIPSDPGDATTAASQYTFSVHPPFDSGFASATWSVAVGASNQALPAITCPAKLTLAGRVLGPLTAGAANSPLPGVPVVIEGNPAAANPGRSQVHNLVTDASGAFLAQVEPGAYRVSAMPTSGLPWGTQLVAVSGNESLPDLVLSDAREVSGTLVEMETSQPISGATVTVYRTPSSALLQPLKLYEALTDENGQFKVVLPRAAGGD